MNNTKEETTNIMTDDEKNRIWIEEQFKQSKELEEKLTEVHNTKNYKNYAFRRLQMILQDIQNAYNQMQQLSYQKKDEANCVLEKNRKSKVTQEMINEYFDEIKNYYKKAIKLTQIIQETSSTENRETTHMQITCEEFLEKFKTMPYAEKNK